MKIKLLNSSQRPSKTYPNDAGWDVFTKDIITLSPGARIKVGLGFCLELTDGYLGLIQGKSGRAFYQGLTTIGNVIDSSYRGEVHAILLNTSQVILTIPAYEKVAQLVILPCDISPLDEVDELSESDRGERGFGSTGNK